jgi:hypothetical protein
MLILLLLNAIYSYACLGHHGTYIIKVKVYLDEDSRMAISDYTQMHRFPKDVLDPEKEGYNYSLAYIQDYFGRIFDEVNMQLKDTDIQLEADYSDLRTDEFADMKEKYCRQDSNIVNMTEAFLKEFGANVDKNVNKIFVINCRANNAYMGLPNHFAVENRCAKTHGILLVEPSTLKNIILDGLYSIFMHRVTSKIFGINKYAAANACGFAHTCNRFYPGTGEFVKDVKAIRHSGSRNLTMEESLVGNFRKDQLGLLPDTFPLAPSV